MENSLVIIIVLVVLAFVASRYVREQTRERKLRYGKHGEQVAVEEVIGQQPIHLNGKGNHTSEPLPLEAGTYKAQYRFPDDILVKVDLWHKGEAETVVLKQGAGVTSFTIAASGRYVFAIAPADDVSPWTLDITRLGLPSRPLSPR